MPNLYLALPALNQLDKNSSVASRSAVVPFSFAFCLVTRYSSSCLSAHESYPTARPRRACATLAPMCCDLLQHAKTRREAIGVELYNFQQQLAKMQMQLEKAQENYAHISQIRRQAEEQLQSLQRTHDEEEQLTSQERLKVCFLPCPAERSKLEVRSPNNLAPYNVQLLQRLSAQKFRGIKRCTLLLPCRAVSNSTKASLSKACCMFDQEPACLLLICNVCA